MPSQTLRWQLPTGSGCDTPARQIGNAARPGDACRDRAGAGDRRAVGGGSCTPPGTARSCRRNPRPVSVPFWMPSRHDRYWQNPGAQKLDWQSLPRTQAWPASQGTHDGRRNRCRTRRRCGPRRRRSPARRLMPSVQTLDRQSLDVVHVCPSPQGRQLRPQSTSLSLPLRTPSLHVGQAGQWPPQSKPVSPPLRTLVVARRRLAETAAARPGGAVHTPRCRRFRRHSPGTRPRRSRRRSRCRPERRQSGSWSTRPCSSARCTQTRRPRSRSALRTWSARRTTACPNASFFAEHLLRQLMYKVHA